MRRCHIRKPLARNTISRRRKSDVPMLWHVVKHFPKEPETLKVVLQSCQDRVLGSSFVVSVLGSVGLLGQ